MRWEVSGHIIAVLLDAVSRICAKQHAASLSSAHQAFSSGVLLVQVVQLYNSTDMAINWNNSCFILSERSDFQMVINLSMLYLKQAVRGISPYVNSDKTEFMDETECISHPTNTIGKGMNPIILPPAMGK